MKALLIGCGEMGEEALRDLVEFGGFEELRIGTRTPSRAEAVIQSLKKNGTRITLHELDASDVESVARLMSGCVVAVNCSPSLSQP
ncbi:MAG: hypothetical protein B7Z63_01270 [Ignavibacteriae bacterium 37-53-5]|nr:MAG: hypothetical protein B7Z63_01270 [Ignavibacteriae bacterium 37-53-5]